MAWPTSLMLDVLTKIRPVFLFDSNGAPYSASNPVPTLRRVRISTNFTRPTATTPYSPGDLVANDTTAGSVAPMVLSVGRISGGSGMIRRARLRKSGTSITNAVFRLHLYRTLPTVTNGDNGVWLTNQAAGYVGSIDIICDKAFSDGASGNGAAPIGSEINFQLQSGTDLYGLVEARAAYTPTASEVFTFELEVVQD